MGNLLGIRFAPLCVPLQRRLQTLLVAYYVYEFVVFPGLYTALVVGGLWTRFWYLSVAYIVYYFVDFGKER